ncbi:lipocalin-like domain-containing protein (plasmid) [Rhodococcus qingshengii]|uniref:lipocalin-like domain-containing protein n=1 Tax=Rhodococcus qingshengii TaxID=334542 RepID=UPI002113814D|nr:lipocalin-like domain-containing protein [Rhodococcus qingshengii]UUE28540.1 lipocalin-like domain-containing protein [Rhodococcus qingshengii]
MTIDHEQLVGAWKLVSALEVFTDGQCQTEFGPNAAGYLSYSPNGIVTAILGDMSRPNSGASDPQSASDDDLAAMSHGFIAYAGPFTIIPAADTVVHHLDLALFTDWQGGEQLRSVRIDGDYLYITGSPRITSDGRCFHSELCWKRF